jgi:hypothetical protein
MKSTITTPTLLPQYHVAQFNPESSTSSVSWPAIFAGASVAVGVSMILLFLGIGLGIASVSPWYMPSATAVTVSSVLGLIIAQAIASGLGGYITGRLRTKWTKYHTDEIYFRDSAHGLVTWTVATIFTATVMASIVTMVIGASTGAAIATYDTRSAPVTNQASPAEIPGQELERTINRARVENNITDADIEKARKATSYASLTIALSMFISAFVSCGFAVIGGKHRDDHDED